MARNLIIIGSGPAGYTAAVYAARAELKPLVFEGTTYGGQLMTTTDVENWPGYAKGIMGPELMEQMREQAKRFGAELVSENVTAVDFSSRPFKVTAGSRTEEADAVIVSTGASHRRLGLESESKLFGKGVSACATCDAFFFKDKVVAVVGGGDSAMEEATFISRFASKVVILVRTEKLRASKIMTARCQANPKVEFVYNVEVVEVLGVEQGHVTGLKLKDTRTGETRDLPCDGMFLAIGLMPSVDLFKGKLELDERGYIKTKNVSETSVPGVFAAGDVQDWKYRQAVTAAGSGCAAALDAQRYLEKMHEGKG
ncbi:MAG TPA: thioredoxin-disulfide reductase [Candidatus Binatia bacterium]|jgi:thioredoxin reductase (NADPH)|nr:thioredoxin-disulfide reductase [Candidatus Binatia bacterium]